jgi:hypothetical protein
MNVRNPILCKVLRRKKFIYHMTALGLDMHLPGPPDRKSLISCAAAARFYQHGFPLDCGYCTVDPSLGAGFQRQSPQVRGDLET